MTVLAAAVVAAAALTDGGTAIALDDGTVWRVGAGEWEELGGCDDGEVVALEADGGRLAVECGDGTVWTWSDDAGWAPRLEVTPTFALDVTRPARRSWWPFLELSMRMRKSAIDRPTYEGWVRLRWDL